MLRSKNKINMRNKHWEIILIILFSFVEIYIYSYLLDLKNNFKHKTLQIIKEYLRFKKI